MKTEYRIIFTATFNDDIERDKAYVALKTFVTSPTFTTSANFKRADMTPDEYQIPSKGTTSEKVI